MERQRSIHNVVADVAHVEVFFITAKDSTAVSLSAHTHAKRSPHTTREEHLEIRGM